MPAVTDAAQKLTPLHHEHVRRGAKIIPFGEWLMPVQYSGIVDEHNAVRKNLGVFDISHMGQLLVAGPGSGPWLDTMLTNNIGKLEISHGQYTFLLNEGGGIIDDLIVYRVAAEEFLLVVNASRANEDLAWLGKHLTAGIDLRSRSDCYAGLAIQGPRAVEFFHEFFGEAMEPPPRNQIGDFEYAGVKISVARTGYTGEDGFEWFFPSRNAAEIWSAILEKGEPLGLKPCGLGARDTLRLEMCYPLNGSDLSPTHNPVEAGLGFFVDVKKEKFIGREKVAREKEEGPARKLVPFRMTSKSPPPRPHYRVFVEGKEVGEVTSGTVGPSVNQGIGMTYLPAEFAQTGMTLEIDIRGQKFPAIIEKKPFYKKS